MLSIMCFRCTWMSTACFIYTYYIKHTHYHHTCTKYTHNCFIYVVVWYMYCLYVRIVMCMYYVIMVAWMHTSLIGMCAVCVYVYGLYIVLCVLYVRSLYSSWSYAWKCVLCVCAIVFYACVMAECVLYIELYMLYACCGYVLSLNMWFMECAICSYVLHVRS